MLLTQKFEEYRFLYRYVLYSLFFFVISAALGYYTAATQTQEVMAIFEELVADLDPLITLGPVTLFLLIFFNNTIKTFLMMVSGVFFGIAPAVFVFSNGYILGVVGHLIIHEAGITPLLAGIIPHGIIEIPIMLCAAAYGFWLGSRFILTIKYGESIKYHLQSAIRSFLQIGVPLFFFAAFVEVFVTDYILNMFL
jgi:stage II sporulation protein M